MYRIPPDTAPFSARGGWAVDQLCSDLAVTRNQAGGIVGNLGYETNGFNTLQEVTPLSGRGGYGWAQWTGSRRIAFEAWCQSNSLAPSSDAANYGFLLHELTGDQSHALVQLRKTTTLESAVFTFGSLYERPYGTTTTHLPGYTGRLKFANLAVAGSATDADPPSDTDVKYPLHPVVTGTAAGGLAAAIAINLSWACALIHLTVPPTVESAWIVIFGAIGALLIHRNLVQ